MVKDECTITDTLESPSGVILVMIAYLYTAPVLMGRGSRIFYSIGTPGLPKDPLFFLNFFKKLFEILKPSGIRVDLPLLIGFFFEF